MSTPGTGSRHRGPASPLARLVEETSGPVADWHDASWNHAESEVWEARLASGGCVFVKCHRQPAKFVQERDAYERWTPAAKGCPKLLAARSQHPRALVLEAVPGEPLLNISVPAGVESEHYRRAGRWLRRLHRLPWEDRDHTSIPDALAQRSRAWCQRAAGKLPPGVIEKIHGRVTAPWPAGAPLPRRVPCHRDFTARNWIVAGDTFHVIDFEHARADWSLVDVERVRSSIPAGEGRLWRAFLDGYGSEVHGESLGRLELHAALSRVAWAVEHGDEAFERSGRATIAARLCAPYHTFDGHCC